MFYKIRRENKSYFLNVVIVVKNQYNQESKF